MERASEPKRTPTTATAEDVEQGVKLIWTCAKSTKRPSRQQATVINTGDGRSKSARWNLLPLVPVDATEILTTTGHLRERSPQRQPLTVGRFERSR